MNRLTDYGIVLLTALATEGGSGLPARELAARTALPLPTVVKLLKLLGRAGLLVSHRGTKGGYSLARPAREVSMAEVIEALEGPLGITECHVPESCEHESLCPTRPNWMKVNRVLHDALERLTLEEMTRVTAPREPEPAFAGSGMPALPTAARSVVR